jgi:ribonucleoside-triphosphate reductase
MSQKEYEILKSKRQLCEVYSRVVGYIRPVNQWNVGKQEEFKDRKVFVV